MFELANYIEAGLWAVGVIEQAMFELANYIEAGLWAVFALGFAVHAIKASCRARSLIAAIALLLFGLSDVVEVHTGAWWRPWWLLLWKAACLLVFLLLILHYRRAARASKAQSIASMEST